MTTASFPTAESALFYRQAHDRRVRELARKTMPTLRNLASAVACSPVAGYSRDELTRLLLETDYPLALLNEATHVLHHQPGETWPACEHCHPHQGSVCECPRRHRTIET